MVLRRYTASVSRYRFQQYVILYQRYFPQLFLVNKVVNLLDITQNRLKVNLKILEQTILEPKHPSVNNGVLVLMPRLLNISRLDDIATLLNNIQLNQSVISLALVRNRIKLLFMQTVNVTNISQPRVQKTKVLGRHGSLDTTAAVVAADDDVLDA